MLPTHSYSKLYDDLLQKQNYHVKDLIEGRTTHRELRISASCRRYSYKFH